MSSEREGTGGTWSIRRQANMGREERRQKQNARDEELTAERCVLACSWGKELASATWQPSGVLGARPTETGRRPWWPAALPHTSLAGPPSPKALRFEILQPQTLDLYVMLSRQL